jgi:hypothetical protein
MRAYSRHRAQPHPNANLVGIANRRARRPRLLGAVYMSFASKVIVTALGQKGQILFSMFSRGSEGDGWSSGENTYKGMRRTDRRMGGHGSGSIAICKCHNRVKEMHAEKGMDSSRGK